MVQLLSFLEEPGVTAHRTRSWTTFAQFMLLSIHKSLKFMKRSRIFLTSQSLILKSKKISNAVNTISKTFSKF